MDGAEREVLETPTTWQQLLESLGRRYRVRPHLAGSPRPPVPSEKPTLTFALLDIAADEIQAFGESAWQVPLPAEWADDATSRSTVVLLEDGKPLAHPHAPHDQLLERGSGRYSHWNGYLLFSSSDDSDPRTNGRSYTVARAEALLLSDFADGMGPPTGLSWVLNDLPAEWTSDADGLSPLVLLEDGRRLGPAHMPHAEIREIGRGRFSHFGRALWFSTSDGSDPRRNGRTYTVICQGV